MPTGIYITEKLKESLIEYYKSYPMTIKNCADKFGLSNPTVIKILNEYNVIRYKKAQVYNPKLIENYFNVIDTEHKAYWLGFLITDGNVHIPKYGNRQSAISITQSENRNYILQMFLDDLKSNITISGDGRGTSMVAVRSNIMANDLAKYGISPNKTLETYLPIIEDNLMPHLIRGIIDGDGSITSTITSRGKHKHAISICGTNKLMSDIGKYIESHLNIKCPKIYDYTDRHLSEIKWQSIENCEIIGNWIYKDATIFITDKKQNFLNFLNYYNR